MKPTRTLLLLLLSTSALYAQEDAWTASMERGQSLYKKKCAVCHSKNGTGKRKRIPPLAKSDYLMNNRKESIRAIKYGLEGKITVNGTLFDKVMKAIDLSDKEISDIMNYVMNSWGNTSVKKVTIEEVSAVHMD